MPNIVQLRQNSGMAMAAKHANLWHFQEKMGFC